MSHMLLQALPWLVLMLLLLLGRYPGEERVARFARSQPTRLRVRAPLRGSKRRPQRWCAGGRVIACSAAARAPPGLLILAQAG